MRYLFLAIVLFNLIGCNSLPKDKDSSNIQAREVLDTNQLVRIPVVFSIKETRALLPGKDGNDSQLVTFTKTRSDVEELLKNVNAKFTPINIEFYTQEIKYDNILNVTASTSLQEIADREKHFNGLYVEYYAYRSADFVYGMSMYPWDTSGMCIKMYSSDIADTVLAHEIGHCLGLAHSWQPDQYVTDVIDEASYEANNDSSYLAYYNVMNYVDKPLKDLFYTPEQLLRMRAVLFQYRQNLLK